jgi:hypothetical protein
MDVDANIYKMEVFVNENSFLQKKMCCPTARRIFTTLNEVFHRLNSKPRKNYENTKNIYFK